MKNDETLDGAWLCFYNFEGIEAKMENFDNLFIDQFEAEYPNFSALELMTTQETMEQKGEAICKFIEVTNKMVEYIQKSPIEAQSIYYDYTNQERTALMDAIIEDTLTRFETDIKADSRRWKELYNFLHEMDLVELSDAEYAAIWETPKH